MDAMVASDLGEGDSMALRPSAGGGGGGGGGGGHIVLGYGYKINIEKKTCSGVGSENEKDMFKSDMQQREVRV